MFFFHEQKQRNPGRNVRYDIRGSVAHATVDIIVLSPYHTDIPPPAAAGIQVETPPGMREIDANAGLACDFVK